MREERTDKEKEREKRGEQRRNKGDRGEEQKNRITAEKEGNMKRRREEGLV